MTDLKSEKPAAEGTANRLQKSAHTGNGRGFKATIPVVDVQASAPDPNEHRLPKPRRFAQNIAASPFAQARNRHRGAL